MKMTIKNLKIENFKGVKNFELSPNADLTVISAKNGVGKTTIYDAFLWLLFGINSAGDAKFDIRPKDAPYEIEPTVSAVIVVDGKETELKKVYSSKFTKDTGEFKELKTEAFINGVKKGVREYERIIADFVEFNYFKLLTNPRYFSEELEWQGRRELLFQLANLKGEVEIASTNENFRPLLPHIDKYGDINEYKKFLKAEDKALTERLNKIKTRIDEVYRTVDTSVNLDYENETLASTKSEIETLKKELYALENGENVQILKAKKAQLDGEYYKLVSENDKKIAEQRSEHNAKFDELINAEHTEINEIKAKISENNAKILTIKANTDSLKTQKNMIAERYKTLKSEAPANVCPTCKRPYDDEETKKSLEEWQKKYAEEKQKLVAEASQVNLAIETNLTIMSEYITANDELTAKLKTATEKATQLEKDKHTMKIETPIEFTKKIEEYIMKRETIEEKINNAMNGDTEKIKEIKARIDLLNLDVANSERRIEAAHANLNAENRIEELRTEQREIADKKAKIQRDTDLVKEFILAKIGITEKEINNKFRFVKFKLFTQNVTNDDINECCEAIAFNSPSYKNLSYSQKSIVGLDIISAFSKRFGIDVPMFFDNLDSLDTDNKKMIFEMTKTQKIALVVSDKPALTVEQ